MSAPAREDLRKGWCPGALRPMPARDGLLVRLRITGGIVPAGLAETIADLAERHGNGLLDLSARANLQLRGVREAALPALLEGLDALDLLDGDAGAEAVRNVLASPLAGVGTGYGEGLPLPLAGRGQGWGSRSASRSIDAHGTTPTPSPSPQGGGEHPDIRPLVLALERALVADPALRALPAKFGFLVDDGGAPSLAGIAADIRFDWVAAERAFAVGLGGTAADALAVGLVAPEALVARAIALAHRLLAMRGEPRRIGRLIREIGPDAVARWFAAEPLLVIPGRVTGADPEPIADAREAPFLRDQWVSGSAAPPRNDKRPGAAGTIVGPHTFGGIRTLGLAAPFGRLDAAMLRATARLAETGAGELRLTPWRTILVPHAPTADLDTLAAAGLIVDPADPRLRVAACTGRSGCERGTTDTHADATALADLAAALPGDGVVLHVSGCAKGCARPQRTAVTLVGRDGRYDLIRDGRPGDDPVSTGLDVARIRAALRGFEDSGSSPVKRGRGTMRSVVEGAATASIHPVLPAPSTGKTEVRQPPPPPTAVPLPRFAGEDGRGET